MVELSAVEIVKRLDGGITRPFLCGCDDGKKYVVKGLPHLPRKELIAEWVCAHLTHALQLPFPSFAKIWVDDGLVKYRTDWNADLKEGWAFGCEFIEHAMPITFTQAHTKIDEINQKLIYLFDIWTKNSDRTLSPKGEGNVNIIYDVGNSRFFLIDHNQSFAHDCAIMEFRTHVFSSDYRKWIHDLADRQHNEDLLSSTLIAFDNACDAIPDEWRLDGDEHQQHIEFMKQTLLRVNDDLFWRDVV